MSKRPETDFSSPLAQPFYHEGGEHGVLLVHGFTGSAAHMRLLADHLAEAGFTVQTVNLPGHATHLEDMKGYRWSDWLDYAENAARALGGKCKYLSVAGLSMGGVITLILAQRLHLTLAVPISAPMAAQNRMLPLAKYAAPFMPVIYWGGGDERPSVLDERYDLGYAGFPTRNGDDLYRLIRMARKGLGQITCPLLAVQSHADETIAPASADLIMQGIKSRKKRTLWLDDVPHVCTISREHRHIADEMIAWLRAAEKEA